MLGGLVRLLLFRVLGGRVLLAIAAFEWLRRALAGRRDDPTTHGHAGTESHDRSRR